MVVSPGWWLGKQKAPEGWGRDGAWNLRASSCAFVVMRSAWAAYCGPRGAIQSAQLLEFLGLQVRQGGRTGPALWPLMVAPAFTIDTA